MKNEILIDKLTPCLTEVATGKIFHTTFSLATTEEIEGLHGNGWSFNWNDYALRSTNIYKLLLKDDNVIQGLVSAEVVKNAVYIHLTESAPHNLGDNKKFEGVGGHLFAIAIKLSKANGFGGYVFFEAKNTELVEHYTDKLGAQLLPTRIHDYRMEIPEENAMNILEQYTLEGDLNVE